MATIRWKGKAVTTAKTMTVQITGGDATTTYKLTLNGKVVSYTGNATVATIATGLAAAWEASTEPEFSEIAASAATDTVTLTMNTAGVEFTATSSVSGGAGTIGAATVATANSGPNDATVTTNWDGDTPNGSDDVYLDNSEISLKYNLDQSAAGTQTLLQIDASFTGDVGLPENNQDGTSYLEYREQYYKINATSVIVGRGPGQGSGRIKINGGSVQSAVLVESTGTGSDQDIEALLWKGTHASNTLTVKGNSQVGVAVYSGEAATIATLTVDGQAQVRIGAGVTLGTVVVYGGTVVINCAVATSITMYGGDVTINGTGACASAVVYGGALHYNTTGTLGGAPIVGETGQIDFSGDPRAKTVTNPIDVANPNGVNDPQKVVAALVVDWNNTTPFEGLGRNIRLTRGTPA